MEELAYDTSRATSAKQMDAMDVGQISSALEAAESLLVQLRDQISALGGDIASVLRPEGPDKVLRDVLPEPIRSQLAMRIAQLRDDIYSLQGVVSDYRARIDL